MQFSCSLHMGLQHTQHLQICVTQHAFEEEARRNLQTPTASLLKNVFVTLKYAVLFFYLHVFRTAMSTSEPCCCLKMMHQPMRIWCSPRPHCICNRPIALTFAVVAE